MKIVILRNCPAETGRDPWSAGQTVEASETYARALIGRGDAYDADGRLVDVTSPVDDTGTYPSSAAAYAEQFGTLARAVPVRRITVAATGLLGVGPCALLGWQAIENGSSGTLYIDDALAAGAGSRRCNMAYTDLTDGGYYPAVDVHARAAMLVSTDLYVTVPTGGVIALDIIDGSAIPGVEGEVLFVEPIVVSATGLAIEGPCHVLSMRIIDLGSSGNWCMHGDTSAAVAARQLMPIKPYSDFGANNIYSFGATGVPVPADSVYATVPTAGKALLFVLPR